ncbi:MAG TPA: glutathione S-transferase family protein [Pseudomonadales bacterium]|nr:glutathione S-transferase family protein [Pseudomonadales bacterium]
MTDTRTLTLYHSPNTRSTGALILLEELGPEYELRVLDMGASEQRGAEYMRLNPLGKVPAVVHGHALITEQVAIFIYLADLFPEADLAPLLDDPLRGPYLRWMAIYGSCFEPAIIDRYMKREPAPLPMSPYGDADALFASISTQLEKGPWMLGERFLALDVLWGCALGWITNFGLLEKTPAIAAYLERFDARPAPIRVRAEDAERAAVMA